MKRLRFKDENGKEYPKPSLKKLGDIWKEDNYKTKSNNEYPIISSTKDDVYLQSEYFKRQIASKNNTGYKILYKGRIVLSPQNAWMGNINLNTKYDNGIVSPSYKIYKLVNADSDYFRFLIKTPKFINRIDNFSEQGASIVRKNLNITELLDSKLYTPTLAEQKKIGEFLSSIDRLVDKQKDKVDLLKEMKKGCLQILFPKKGQKIPDLRFKGFTDTWEQRELSQLTDIYDGTHQTPNYTNSGIMFLSVENISTLKSDKFISEEAFRKEFKVYPQKDDILMTRIGDIGTANIVCDNNPKAYYVSLALLKNNKLDPYFLKESIASEHVKREIWHRTLHIAFPKKINKNEIAKVHLFYPRNKEEQIKIGKILYELENLITLHQRKAYIYQQIKKAYMQRLFA